MPAPALLFNGELLPEEGFSLPLPNRGLFFNDGFFETLIWSAGAVRYLHQHVARMQRAAAALGLELPAALASAEQLTATLSRLVADQGLSQGRLRLQLWRRGAGLYVPETTEVNWLATAQPFRATDGAIMSAGFAESVRTLASPLAFCKGPNALLYVLAAQERQRRDLHEVLLLDAAGHVAESVSAAVFWIKDNQLCTPALSTHCVAGVRRAHLLQTAQRHGLATQEIAAPPAALLQADCVFTANVAGIRWIARLGETAWSLEHPVLQELRHREIMP